MISENIFWIIFSVVITVMLLVDLYVTDHRRGKITLKASLIWSGVWIVTALLFNVFLYFYLEDGHQKAIEFLTGYIIEKSLSVDNQSYAEPEGRSKAPEIVGMLNVQGVEICTNTCLARTLGCEIQHTAGPEPDRV